jgi:hypothetical protein
MPRPPAPYEFPDPSGRCWLLSLPDEVLAGIFTRLDRCSLTRSFRVCRFTLSVPSFFGLFCVLELVGLTGTVV